MSGYLDQPTAETRLAAYLESGDLELDIDRLRNEYRQNGWIMPTREELRYEAINTQVLYINTLRACGKNVEIRRHGEWLRETLQRDYGAGLQNAVEKDLGE